MRSILLKTIVSISIARLASGKTCKIRIKLDYHGTMETMITTTCPFCENENMPTPSGERFVTCPSCNLRPGVGYRKNGNVTEYWFWRSGKPRRIEGFVDRRFYLGPLPVRWARHIMSLSPAQRFLAVAEKYPIDVDG
jgi:hypothetical protein